MPLRMSQATAEDVAGLAAILFEEFMEMHEWTRIRFSAMKPEERHAYLAAGLREDLTNPEYPVIIQKMEDTETKEIVGFLQFNDCNVPPSNKEFATQIIKPEGYNVPPIREYYRKMITAQKAAMKDKPFLHVADLATKKSYRRRGISSTLMRWGMEYATKRGVPIYVEATPDGRPLYEKLGFETLDTWSIDMEQHGGAGTYTEAGMIWSPLKTTS